MYRLLNPKKTRKPQENLETGELGNLCPISRKPLKYVCYGHLRNRWKPRKPTEICLPTTRYSSCNLKVFRFPFSGFHVSGNPETNGNQWKLETKLTNC